MWFLSAALRSRRAPQARVFAFPSHPAALLQAERAQTAVVRRQRRRDAGKHALLSLAVLGAALLCDVALGPSPRVALRVVEPVALVAVAVFGIRWLGAAAACLAPAWGWGATPDAERSLAAGIAGESLVSERLARELPGGPGGYVVVNNLRLPSMDGDIDHVVIGPSGVFVLETKAVNGVVQYFRGPNAAAGTWCRTKVGRRGGTYEAAIDDAGAQVRRNVHALATYLRRRAPDTCARVRLWVEGLLVFAHPQVMLAAGDSPVPAVRADEASARIRAARPPRTLHPEDVARFVGCLLEVEAPTNTHAPAPIAAETIVRPAWNFRRPSRAAGALAVLAALVLGAGQRGSALVETALVLPLLLTLAFGVVGVGRVAQSHLAVAAVAREAARAGALAATPSEALAAGTARAREVAAGYGIDERSVRLVVDASAFGRGGSVRASAAYDVTLSDLPLMGWVRAPVSSVHVEPVDPYRSFWAGAP